VGGQHQAVSPHLHHPPPPVHHQQLLQDGAALDVKTPSEDSGVDVANQWGTRYRFSFAPVRSLGAVGNRPWSIDSPFFGWCVFFFAAY
jgi:hypothetical protein